MNWSVSCSKSPARNLTSSCSLQSEDGLILFWERCASMLSRQELNEHIWDDGLVLKLVLQVILEYWEKEHSIYNIMKTLKPHQRRYCISLICWQVSSATGSWHVLSFVHLLLKSSFKGDNSMAQFWRKIEKVHAENHCHRGLCPKASQYFFWFILFRCGTFWIYSVWSIMLLQV